MNRKEPEPSTPALSDAPAAEPVDETLVALMRAYQKYRYAIFALGTCCVALLAASMGLYKGGVIDGDVQFMMIMGTYVFVAVILFLVFTRVRPIKADIRSWKDALQKAEESPRKSKKKQPEQPESLAKESKHPPTPEYRKMRLYWRACIIVAVVIMFSAMALIRIHPEDATTPIIVLTSSYVFLAIAVYLEIKKLKPMRTAWDAQRRKVKKKPGASSGRK